MLGSLSDQALQLLPGVTTICHTLIDTVTRITRVMIIAQRRRRQQSQNGLPGRSFLWTAHDGKRKRMSARLLASATKRQENVSRLRDQLGSKEFSQFPATCIVRLREAYASGPVQRPVPPHPTGLLAL